MEVVTLARSVPREGLHVSRGCPPRILYARENSASATVHEAAVRRTTGLMRAATCGRVIVVSANGRSAITVSCQPGVTTDEFTAALELCSPAIAVVTDDVGVDRRDVSV